MTGMLSLLRLWALLIVTTFAPCATFVYANDIQTKFNYDDSSEYAVGYDAVSVPATGEKKTGVMGDRILFAKFARFLVARGISKLDDAANAVEDFFLGGLGKIIKMQMGIRF